MRAKISEPQMQSAVSVITGAVTNIFERKDTTELYQSKIDAIDGASDCCVKVASTKIEEGYRQLDLHMSRETVSYRNEEGLISYRTLTHVLNGKTMSFGLCCSPKGDIELYRFLSAGAVDCEKLAMMRVSKHICDPIYGLLSEDKIYIIYNVPSESAMAATVSQRTPQIDDDGASASGYPGIACFDLKERHEVDLLPPFKEMSQYSCGMYFNAEKKEPMLCVANIYERKEEVRPSLRRLLLEMIEESDNGMAEVALPIGVSSIAFVKKTEISQSPIDGDPANGIVKIILRDSNEDGTFLFSIKGMDESSDDIRDEKQIS